ncbi:MAG TPA: sugar phosphate isomerase/epimerase [Chitinophagaceae bacterium]|nr:sugar phosphate isomerase/epimerase [Chitinophagaceae bacterium]
MLKRRQFLKSAGTFALGGLMIPRRALANLFTGTMTHPVGLQLYTMNAVIDQDVPGTLEKVAAIGYRELESAFSAKGAFYGYTPKAFSALTRQYGLSWISHHVLGAPFQFPPNGKMPLDKQGKPVHFPPMMNLKDNGPELVDEAAAGGLSWLVCATTPIGSLDEIQASIRVLNRSGELARKAGIQLAYHNHFMEFRPVQGKIPYDLLLHGLDPDLVKMELDIAWATKGGADPVKLFRENPGRFPLWHVKDISADMNTLEPVGKGVVNFKRIFANARIAGMQHFFVEHDHPPHPFASITTSYQYLKALQV